MEDKSSSEYGVRNSELVEEKNVTGYKLEVALEPETNSPNLESRNLGTCNLKPFTVNSNHQTLKPLSTALSFTKRGYAILKQQDGKNWDELLLGLLLFFGGLAGMIGVAYAYSGYTVFPGMAIFLLIVCLIACIVGYVLIEDAVPGLGCLLLAVLQIFTSIL